jgi:hypothetical protein
MAADPATALNAGTAPADDAAPAGPEEDEDPPAGLGK